MCARSLLSNFLSPLTPEPAELRFLVWATEGMSGADIEMLVDAGKRFLVLHRRTEPISASRDERSEQSRNICASAVDP